MIVESRELSRKFTETRHRLRRILLFRGIFLCLAALIAGVIVAVMIDATAHVSAGLRFLFLSSVFAMSAWLAYQLLWKPLRTSLRDLDLALRLERLHPELEEVLSSTVEFQRMSDADPLAGSAELRRAVAERALAQTGHLDFREMIAPHASRKSAVIFAISLAIALAFTLALPRTSAIGVARLFLPWHSPEWPKRTHLEIVSYPKRVAKGDPFVVEVEVGGVVPDRIALAYRFADGSLSPPTVMNTSSSSETRFVGTMANASESFEYQITGGDSTTDWLPVEVAPAPDVENIELTLMPPAYTKLPPTEYPPGRGHVEALIGTEVHVVASSTKPLAKAWLEWTDKQRIDIALDDAGVSLATSFKVEKEDAYQFLLEDREGMDNSHRSPKRFRVQAIVDRAPDVRLDQPTSDREATRQARVPIRATVTDDFGIQDISLRYAVQSSASADQLAWTDVRLYQSQENLAANAIDHEWNLADLALPIGSVVRMKISARDFKDPPNVGESREIVLQIVSDAEFVRQLDTEQKLIREELERLRKLQESALRDTSELAEKSRAGGPPTPRDREQMQSNEAAQRRVREKASTSESSVKARIGELLRKLADNGVKDLDSEKRLTLMDSELARVDDQHLSSIERSLTRARKQAESNAAKSAKDKPQTADAQVPHDADPAKATDSEQSSPSETAENNTDNPAPMSESSSKEASPSTDASAEEKSPDRDSSPTTTEMLDDAKEHQRAVVESLDAMLEQLDKWSSVAEVVNEARELERRQAETNRDVDDLAQRTLGKRDSELTPEEKGAIQERGVRQDELRQHLARLERQLSKQIEKSLNDDPAAAEAMKEALERSRQENLAGKMAEAADDIRANKLSEAGQAQKDIGEALRSLVDSLENRQENELKRLVKSLRDAERDLKSLEEEQRRLRKDTEAAQALTDADKRKEELQRLKRRQQEIQQRAEEFARRLSKLQAKSASRALGQAGEKMADAGQSLEQDDANQAGADQEETLEELQQAAEEVAQARQKAEDQLAFEQLGRVADSIKAIQKRQLSLKDEAGRLDQIRSKDGKLSRGQAKSVLSLSRAQRGLADEANLLREKLDQAKVFVLVVEDAIEYMRKAADRLEERMTDERTQQLMNRALDRFNQLVESLRSAEKKKEQGNQGQGQGEGEGGARPPSDGIPDIAQVKLLRRLQQEILEDTRRLLEEKEELTPDQQDEWNALTTRQGKLADLVRELAEEWSEVDEEENDEEAPQ